MGVQEERNSRRTIRQLLSIAHVSALICAAAPAMAQSTDAAADRLDEVVVTATRREERLQDVPISATVFSPEKINAQGLHNIDDLARLSPGITFQRSGTGTSGNENDEDSSINIRGIDSSAGAATIGVYVDDTPIQGRHLTFTSFSAYPALFDLERVEVLRGPQGTLFGAGSEGGTLRFIQPAPGLDKVTGYARSDLATTKNGDPTYELGAAIGGPIIDGVLGFRLSASFREDGGWVDRVDYRTQRVTDAAANSQRTTVVRAALKWKPTDSLAITPSVYYQELHLNDTAAYWPDLSNPSDSRFANGNATRNSSTDPFYLAAIKVESDLGFAQLTSNVSYFSRRQHSMQDYTAYDRTVFGLTDFGPRPPLGDTGVTYDTDSQKNVYFETRLQSVGRDSRLTWTGGFYFARTNENTTEHVIDPTLDTEFTEVYGESLCTDEAPCPNGEILTQPLFRVIDSQYALFGDATYTIAESWKVTGGLRVARTEFKGDLVNYGPFFAADTGPTTPLSGSGSGRETPVTPRAVLTYQPDPAMLFYASAAKGYRVGGINLELSSLCADDLASIGLTAAPDKYAADSLWSYEIGSKTTLADGRMQINSSLFLIDWKNIQQAVYLPDCGQGLVENLGTVRSIGGEVEAQMRLGAALQLGISVAYHDAKYTKTVCGGPTDCTGDGATSQPVVSRGDRLPGAPWTILLSTEYSLPPAWGSKPYVRLDYQIATAQTALQPFQNTNNGISDPEFPGLPNVRTLAVRAGMRWNGLDFSLYANNLTNTAPLLFRSRDSLDSDLYFAHTIRPRTVGITTAYRF